MVSEPKFSCFELRKTPFSIPNSLLFHSLSLSFSLLFLSPHLPKAREEKQRKNRTQRRHVFPKQAPRHGPHETVNFPFSFFEFIKVSIFSLSLILSIFFCSMMSDYKVDMINDGMQEFCVHFHGPKDSLFPFLFFLSSTSILCFSGFFTFSLFYFYFFDVVEVAS